MIPPLRSTSLKSAIVDFLREARSVPRDVIIVFLATAVLNVLSYYFGSRRFFNATFFETLGGDPLFPLYEYLFWFGSEFVVFFLAPVLILILIHRQPLRLSGLGVGDWRFGMKWTAIFFIVMLPILWVASSRPEFMTVYPHAQIVKTSWHLFLLYEAAFLLYFIGWEFIWRGYVLFSLEKPLGAGVAVLVQMIPFVLLHNGKPLAETFGAILAGIALGALALRTRSFWYCVITHWLVMFTIDLFSTLRSHTGASGIGPHAVFQLFGG
jgi:uncharacterized protein